MNRNIRNNTKGQKIQQKRIDSIESSSIRSSTDINVQHFVKDGEQKRMLGTSEKFFDANATVTLATAGAIVDLFAPAQGVGVSQRVGDSAKFKRMLLHLDSIDVTDISVITRVIIFQWHPSSALAVPVVTDILQGTTYNSPHEFATSQNYTVLSDIVFTQNNTTAAGVATATTALSDWRSIFPKKGFDATIMFSPAATTGTNKIYMLRICSKAAVSSLVYYSRIIYTDT